MKKKVKTVLIIVSLLYTVLFFTSYRPILPGYHAWYYTPEKYNVLKSEVAARKKKIGERYKHSKNKNEKEVIISNARESFRKTLTQQVFPFWYGTYWTFSGNTEVPGDASIACGYFVSTTIRDMDCKVNRVRLAQAASEEMIKSLVKEKYILRFNNVSIEAFMKKIKNIGEGVYVVGLDNHTGFLICENDNVSFVHSSGRFPFCVIKEEAIKSTTLKYSKYKVVGCLTKDESFMRSWIIE